MRPTRRDVIQLAGAGLAAGAFHSAAAAATVPSQTEKLIRLLGAPRSAEAIGQAYLTAQGNAGPTLATLWSGVVGALRLDATALQRGESDALKRRLQARIRQDFAERNVVEVDGWILSRVETEICAIACLTAASRS
jgi:hypothetical protein